MQGWFLRAMVGLYRRTGGRIGGRVGSTPILLLTTTGRKSGVSHTVPLGYFDRGDVRFVVASNSGAPRHPAWYFNLTAHPEVRVEIGRDAYAATVTTATGEERAQLWNFLMETAPLYRRYQRTAREIPVVMLRRTG
ncbi:MAG TPA: nitroreductase family deazaflavin-dependent oxidoreductase [Ktedonobacteraceae bacterium]|nr:nitroreductase family deazaflavin-dependent oxidoreductase [Ktedonobacteraceae bacterium]